VEQTIVTEMERPENGAERRGAVEKIGVRVSDIDLFDQAAFENKAKPPMDHDEYNRALMWFQPGRVLTMTKASFVSAFRVALKETRR